MEWRYVGKVCFSQAWSDFTHCMMVRKVFASSNQLSEAGSSLKARKSFKDELRSDVIFQQRWYLFKTFCLGSRLSHHVTLVDGWLMCGVLVLEPVLCLLYNWLFLKMQFVFLLESLFSMYTWGKKKADFTAVKTCVHPRSQELSCSFLLTNSYFSSRVGWQCGWESFSPFFRTFFHWGCTILSLDTKNKPTNQNTPQLQVVPSKISRVGNFYVLDCGCIFKQLLQNCFFLLRCKRWRHKLDLGFRNCISCWHFFLHVMPFTFVAVILFLHSFMF